ncbi:MAG: hypothetical protein AAF266_09425 [Planctomycetota bacterium]
MKLDHRPFLSATFARWMATGGMVVLIAIAGCDSNTAPAKRSSNAARAQRQGTTALFSSIRNQLRALPESAQMQLAPPTVVLDSRSSTDGEDIEGRLQRRPEAPGEPANLIVIPRANSRFRGNVEPGDIVKYYGVLDRATQERLNETGEVDIATFDSIDLIVAQVLRDDALLIQGGFPQEDAAPRKIEVWRITDDRMQEIQRQWSAYVAKREPPLAWHPSPDEAAIGQLTERLNQWLRQTRVAGKRADAANWKRPTLLATLLESIRSDERIAETLADAELSTGYFDPYESRQIQGATWRRDVSRWARGGDLDAAATAQSLFDWTVRNLQLVADDEVPPRWPWETMLHGKATAEGRAWVFAGLCEQQNLTAAIVSVPTEETTRTLVGVLDGDALRMFDPALGLPIPGEEPQSIATLAELAENDELLRSLDLTDQQYPVTAEALASASLHVVASPLALTRRAKAFAAKLTADDAVVLATDIDAVAERLTTVAGERSVTLWPEPFETLLAKLTAKPSERRQAVREFLPFAWRPPLWKGRLLQFRGVKRAADEKRGPLDDAVDDHRTAQQLYMDRTVRPTSKRLAGVPKEKREIYEAAKVAATIFSGTLAYDEGAYEVSKGWFENTALETEAAEDYGPIVTYNLARAYEQPGETDKAIELLESIEGPMAAGAKVRAKQLRESAAEAVEADSE